MKIDLLKIEGKLKEFFEKDLQIVAHKDPLQGITEEMISVLGKNLIDADGKIFAPNIYRVSIKDKKLISKDDLKEWKNYIQEILKDIIRDNSFQLAGPLHIQIFHNDKIKKDYEVSVSSSSVSTGKTINLFSSAKKKKPAANVINGYLITADETYHKIKKAIINIGRREDNDLVIDNLRVSRVHAQIRQIDNKHVVFDLDSTTGTKVNGVKVRQHALNHGDVIEIADVPVIYMTNEGDDLNEENKTKTRSLSPSGKKEIKSKK
jgi:NhaP-type Na+/H+ and K+/H+ antiporter